MSRLFYACSHEDKRITLGGLHFDVMSRLMTKPTKCPVRPAKTDQPGHLPSRIRVFAVRMEKHEGLSYHLSPQWRLWSDWADAQANLSLCRAHTRFVGFLMSRLFYACSHDDNRITFRGCHFDVMSRLMTKSTKCPVRPAKTDQPGHPPSRIRVFVVRMKKHKGLSYHLSPQWRLIRLGGCPG